MGAWRRICPLRARSHRAAPRAGRRAGARIQPYDERIQQMARKQYPETALLTAVAGVGVLIALTFILPWRTHIGSEEPGCGRLPGDEAAAAAERRAGSELGISKEGDVYLRKLLVQGAHVILGRNGSDSDLRRFGQRLISRAVREAKKKARVAVARKLAVLAAPPVGDRRGFTKPCTGSRRSRCQQPPEARPEAGEWRTSEQWGSGKFGMDRERH